MTPHPDDTPEEFRLVLGPFLTSIRMELESNQRTQFDKDADAFQHKLNEQLKRRRKYLIVKTIAWSIAVGVAVGVTTTVILYFTIPDNLVIAP